MALITAGLCATDGAGSFDIELHDRAAATDWECVLAPGGCTVFRSHSAAIPIATC